MAIEVDLEKTNGQLSWEFLEDTLKEVGFAPNLIYLIMMCVYVLNACYMEWVLRNIFLL